MGWGVGGRGESRMRGELLAGGQPTVLRAAASLRKALPASSPARPRRPPGADPTPTKRGGVKRTIIDRPSGATRELAKGQQRHPQATSQSMLTR